MDSLDENDEETNQTTEYCMTADNATEDTAQCCWDGCARPATQTSGGKLLCTDHYNEEYLRNRRRERPPYTGTE